MPLTSTRPELAGTFGMVATTHWLASQTGMSVLERGGNAFDAAAAAGFVLQVVEPHLNGPAGDLPVVLWSAADRRPSVVCGQGPSPRAATLQAFADLGLDVVPGTGLLAATVPGAFGAWTLMLQRWGTWRLRDVLEPAIAYARGGAPLLPRVSATIDAVSGLFAGEWTTSAETYLAGGTAPAPWARMRLTRLGETYERVVAEAEAASGDRDAQLEAARDAWYRGFVADAVDAFCRTTSWRDTSGERHGGLLTGDDLAAWQPTVEEPVSATYRGVEVLKTGPWGQGPVLLQALRLLDGLDLPTDLRDADPQWVHLVTEASKLAFADREAWYGDPEHVDVPLATLLSGAYAEQRRGLVDPERASAELRPGSPDGRVPVVPRPPVGVTGAGSAAVGEPTVRRDGATRGDTCHVDVVDRWGNLVSATPSGAWLQSSPVVPELGFPLGTRAQMFWLTDGLPTTLRPGVRPRTTLSPSLALRDGEPWIAFGTPGGDQQDQWSLVLLLRMVHAAQASRARGEEVWTGLQAAVDAPMFHHDHMPSSFYPRQAFPARLTVEDRFAPAVVAELERRGHDVQVVDGWSLGRLSAVARDSGWLRAAANPRGAQGYAVGR
ncbi:MAG: gamma-glutamyltransferase family protein [Actinomycetes bacterium]